VQPLALLVRSLLVTGEACLTGFSRKARNVEPLLSSPCYCELGRELINTLVDGFARDRFGVVNRVERHFRMVRGAARRSDCRPLILQPLSKVIPCQRHSCVKDTPWLKTDQGCPAIVPT
jgi:hypothetical protein